MDFQKLWMYDIEVFPNFFSVTAKNKMTGKIEKFFLWEDEKGNARTPYSSEEELWNMYNFFYPPKPVKMFCGYNNLKYDDLIMGFVFHELEKGNVVKCNRIFEESMFIIENQNLPFGHKDAIALWNLPYIDNYTNTSIDCLEILRQGRQGPGTLKLVGVKLKHERVQETYYPFDEPLTTSEQVRKTLDYNVNDVDITEKCFDAIRNQVELREAMSIEYDNPQLITKSDSGIAKTLFRKWYCSRAKTSMSNIKEAKAEYVPTLPNQINTGDIIFEDIGFKTPEFQSAFQRLLNTPIVWYAKEEKYDFRRGESGKDNEIVFKLNGVTYAYGLGGVHSEDYQYPGIFFPDDDEIMLDADVASQYPSVILNRKVHPAYLDENHFYEMYRTLVEARIKAKKRAKQLAKSGQKDSEEYIRCKQQADSQKIVINSGYGFFNDKTFIFYDPPSSYRVTLNCQLYLLMLIEDLELNDIKVISANTDGVIVRCKKDKYDTFKEIKHRWETSLDFELEETYYDLYVRKDVNNYIARETSGDIKNKGAFLTSLDLKKGYVYPIVRQALNKYFLENKSVLEYFEEKNNPDDIYDFCAAEKISPSKWKEVVKEKVKLHKIIHKKNSTELLASPKIKYIVQNSTPTQFVNRWFVSKPDDDDCGERLVKNKQLPDGTWQYNTFVTNCVITVFNDYFHSEKYNIDYDFYLERCQKVIDQIENNVNPM